MKGLCHLLLLMLLKIDSIWLFFSPYYYTLFRNKRCLLDEIYNKTLGIVYFLGRRIPNFIHLDRSPPFLTSENFIRSNEIIKQNGRTWLILIFLLLMPIKCTFSSYFWNLVVFSGNYTMIVILNSIYFLCNWLTFCMMICFLLLHQI